MRTIAVFSGLVASLITCLCFAGGPMQGAGGDTAPRQKHFDTAAEAELTTKLETIAPGAKQKSLSTGLYMSGVFTYSFGGGAVSITLDRVNNDSYSATTGTLQLSLWAMNYKPNRGDSITGYRLATFSPLGQLQPRTYFYGISRTAQFLRPPDGAYWLVLVLGEYNPSNCPSNSDGYCLEDTFTSFTQVSWGSAQPSFNYSDLWWTSTESGWGITILQHPSNTIFAAWFTYDDTGAPTWYVAPSCQLVGDYCYGTLYQTHGPPFAQPFNPSSVTANAVGTMSLSFSSYGNALMTYNVRGVISTKNITRQPF